MLWDLFYDARSCTRIMGRGPFDATRALAGREGPGGAQTAQRLQSTPTSAGWYSMEHSNSADGPSNGLETQHYTVASQEVRWIYNDNRVAINDRNQTQFRYRLGGAGDCVLQGYAIHYGLWDSQDPLTVTEMLFARPTFPITNCDWYGSYTSSNWEVEHQQCWQGPIRINVIMNSVELIFSGGALFRDAWTDIYDGTNDCSYVNDRLVLQVIPSPPPGLVV
jgi:hypothetical protein